MSTPVISVENLGKRFRLRHEAQRQRYSTLRDLIAETVRGLFNHRRSAINHQPSTEDFWALRDVSFEVRAGEVIGIIGRNGAGKSTLLKILSRITEPTTGRIRIKGRVASLLEVGTGFHPELTGRENIFLNGAILGMTKAEIKRKFDEIVAFSEVEKFLDTPVKRYSSGMYVRLAFAVAAHLEPEILIVDEVLAVGDAEFQRKCLGKMHDVAAQNGRTVLFVSHNMQAVQSLCSRAMLVEGGRIVISGPTQPIVAHYISRTSASTGEQMWDEMNAPGNHEVKLMALRAFARNGGRPGIVPSKSDLIVELDFFAQTSNPGLCIGFDLTDAQGTTLLRSYQTDQTPSAWPALRKGINSWSCTIPKGLLNAGQYFISPRIGIHNVYWIVNLDAALQFEVTLDHGESPLWNSLNGSNRPGVIAPILQWAATPKPKATRRRELCHSQP